jgi:hypothetical protein
MFIISLDECESQWVFYLDQSKVIEKSLLHEEGLSTKWPARKQGRLQTSFFNEDIR